MLLAIVHPAIPVASYGDQLLSGLETAAVDVLPYAAAITAFAIGVGLVRRWLGARSATSLGDRPFPHNRYYGTADDHPHGTYDHDRR